MIFDKLPLSNEMKYSVVENNQATLLDLQALEKLFYGKTLSGEVIARENNNVVLKLQQGMMLETKIAEDMPIQIGQRVLFEVKHNPQQQIELRPLFENLAQEQTTRKALAEAFLPQNDKTLELVTKLINVGLPIDKTSLQKMYQSMNEFPGTSLSSLVSLKKLNLPITNQNIEQIASYQETNHFIREKVEGLELALQEDIAKLIEGEFTEEVFPLDNTPKSIEMISNQNSIIQEVEQEKLIEQEKSIEQVEPIEQVESIEFNEEESTVIEGAEVLKEPNNKFVSLLFNQNNFIEEKSIKENVKSILEEYFKENFYIKPEVIAKKDGIKDFYQSLHANLAELEEFLLKNELENTESLKNVTAMKKSISFINDINQMFQYVQLPLQLTREKADAELYVFSKKRQMSEQEENFSAYLQLKLEQLGQINIYVEKKVQQLELKISLEKEQTYQLVQQEFWRLEERLKEKNYQVSKIIEMEESKSQDFLSNLQKNHRTITRNSLHAFDVRA